MTGVWRVEVTTNTGRVFDEFVIARTATDAGVVVGDLVRKHHEQHTVHEVRVVAVNDKFRSKAINLSEADALELLRYALHLRMHGENASGGTETWAEFDQRCEALLRRVQG